jgi:hypothetical protein
MNKNIVSKSFQMLIIVFFIGLLIQSNTIFAQENGSVGFTYTINKADTTPVKTSVIDFSEQELLSLPGKSVKDNEVKSLINQKEFYWDVVRDTIASNPDIKPGYRIQKTYYNYKKGFAMVIDADTLKKIILYNDYEERPYRIWKKYTGKLPYKLDFDLKRVFVERLLGKPDMIGSKAETVIYLNRHLFITYFGADPESAIITSITIEKK